MMGQQNEIESVPPCKVWNFRTKSFDVVTERQKREYPRQGSHVPVEAAQVLPGWLSFPEPDAKPVAARKDLHARPPREPKVRIPKPPKAPKPRKIRDQQSWQMSPERIAVRRLFVVQILEAYESGKKQCEIADQMRISTAAISQSVSRFCAIDAEIAGRWKQLITCKCGKAKMPARVECSDCAWVKIKAEKRKAARAAKPKPEKKPNPVVKAAPAPKKRPAPLTSRRAGVIGALSIEQICEMHITGTRVQEIAKRAGVSCPAIFKSITAYKRNNPAFAARLDAAELCWCGNRKWTYSQTCKRCEELRRCAERRAERAARKAQE